MKPINDTTNTLAHHVLAHLYARQVNKNRMDRDKAIQELKSLPEPIKTRSLQMLMSLIGEVF